MAIEISPVYVKATISEENNFTDAFPLQTGQCASISIRRTNFTGTVVLQRKFPDQAEFRTVQNPDGSSGWTAKDIEAQYIATESCSIRLGVPTGSFTGTSVECRLGRG